MSSDRSFGRDEKNLKRSESIQSIDEYRKIYSEVGKTEYFGENNFEFYKFKSLTDYFKVKNKDFKISEVRKIEIINDTEIDKRIIRFSNKYNDEPKILEILEKTSFRFNDLEKIEGKLDLNIDKRNDLLKLEKVTGKNYFTDLGINK